MDHIVPTFYKTYGKYINESRAFPLDVDGLKPVERRVLLSSFQVAKDKLVKSAKVDGHTIANYHPHGTSYSTLVNLVQMGFLEGQGNFGCNFGVDPSPPAAMRYTEVRLLKKTLDLAFRYIQHVPWVESELEKEPKYIPTMFPFCLMGKEFTVGIGFGYRTQIPCFKKEDLFQRLLYLLGIRKSRPAIKPITDCDIVSPDKELEQLLTTGKATIEMQGRAEVDKAKCRAVVKSWPYGRRFESLLNKFSKELENQDIGFADLSTTETNIQFQVLKQRNRDAIFQKFVKKLGPALRGTVTFETIVVDIDGKVHNASIDRLLRGTYNMFTNVNKVMIRTEISKITGLMKEYQTLDKIRPVLSQHLQGKVLDVEKVVRDIHRETYVDEKIIKELFAKYRINKLLTLSTDTEELQERNKQLLKDFDNIQEFVLDQYKDFLKK